jgi:hypothetical protein
MMYIKFAFYVAKTTFVKVCRSLGFCPTHIVNSLFGNCVLILNSVGGMTVYFQNSSHKLTSCANLAQFK